MRSRWSVAICIIGILLAACGTAEQGDGEPSDSTIATDLSIAFFNPIFANSYSQAEGEAIDEIAEENGVDVTHFDAGVDAQAQFRQIEDAVASGQYDGFIIHAVDGPSVVPAVEDAISAGIGVVGIGSALGPRNDTLEPQVEGMVGVAFNPVDIVGEATADLIVRACEGKDPCEVGFLLGDPSFRNSIELMNAVDDHLADESTIEKVAVIEGGFLAGPAYDATNDMLQTNPEIDVIASDGDQMIAGAREALDDMGVTPGEDVLLIGTGASEIAVEGIREGAWFGTTIWLPASTARIGFEMLLSHLRGEPIEQRGISDFELSDRGPILTPDNVDGFTSEWAG